MALTVVFHVKSWQDLGRFCPTVKLVGLQWNVKKKKYIFVFSNNNLKNNQAAWLTSATPQLLFSRHQTALLVSSLHTSSSLLLVVKHPEADFFLRSWPTTNNIIFFLTYIYINGKLLYGEVAISPPSIMWRLMNLPQFSSEVENSNYFKFRVRWLLLVLLDAELEILCSLSKLLLPPPPLLFVLYIWHTTDLTPVMFKYVVEKHNKKADDFF